MFCSSLVEIQHESSDWSSSDARGLVFHCNTKSFLTYQFEKLPMVLEHNYLPLAITLPFELLVMKYSLGSVQNRFCAFFLRY